MSVTGQDESQVSSNELNKTGKVQEGYSVIVSLWKAWVTCM